MRKVISMVGALFLVLFGLILFFNFNHLAHSDIPLDESMKTYEVPFGDWVDVMLHINFSASTDDYYVNTGSKLINNKVRFVVEGVAANTQLGRYWYQGIGSKIEERIELLCKKWTNQGYSISLNDFEINIEEKN